MVSIVVKAIETAKSLCMHATLLQSGPTPCNAMDYSPPGSSLRGILQARMLENDVWQKSTKFCKAIILQFKTYINFFKKECWSGLPCPPPGDLPSPGIKPISLMSPALAGGYLPKKA